LAINNRQVSNGIRVTIGAKTTATTEEAIATISEIKTVIISEEDRTIEEASITTEETSITTEEVETQEDIMTEETTSIFLLPGKIYHLFRTSLFRMTNLSGSPREVE
jgi:hypothetical protein